MKSEPGHEEAAAKVAALFLGGGRRRLPRAKPHRCLGCGKVARLIFCEATYAECQQLYRERQGSGS